MEVLPGTRVCVQCSQEIGGEFEVTVVPENLGKSSGLKKHYGSWTIKKKRRTIQPKEE